MGDVLCPMCGHAVTDPSSKRGVLINRYASIGARLVELRTKLGAIPRGELGNRMLEELELLTEEQRLIRDELGRLTAERADMEPKDGR